MIRGGVLFPGSLDWTNKPLMDWMWCPQSFFNDLPYFSVLLDMRTAINKYFHLYLWNWPPEMLFASRVFRLRGYFFFELSIDAGFNGNRFHLFIKHSLIYTLLTHYIKHIYFCCAKCIFKKVINYLVLEYVSTKKQTQKSINTYIFLSVITQLLSAIQKIIVRIDLWADLRPAQTKQCNTAVEVTQ